jgi:hypothetical protein
MIQRIFKVCIIFLLVAGSAGVYAQEAIPVSGGNASGSGGSVSYSVGQIVFTTNSSASGTIVQGVQQPYEISVVTEIVEAKDINLFISAFPNPATDYLQLKIENEILNDLSYQLYDINGKLLELKNITGTESRISLENVAPSVYFLNVFRGSEQVKVFKIIKY